jgi:hypothetical protein
VLMQMKQRFLNAVISGELGESDDYGVIIKLSEFKKYFSDVKTLYINSFLPAAVIEAGQYNITHTKFVFRVKNGIYRVHPDAIEEQVNNNKPNGIKKSMPTYVASENFKRGPTANSLRQIAF